MYSQKHVCLYTSSPDNLYLCGNSGTKRLQVWVLNSLQEISNWKKDNIWKKKKLWQKCQYCRKIRK